MLICQLLNFPLMRVCLTWLCIYNNYDNSKKNHLKVDANNRTKKMSDRLSTRQLLNYPVCLTSSCSSGLRWSRWPAVSSCNGWSGFVEPRRSRGLSIVRADLVLAVTYRCLHYNVTVRPKIKY